MASVTFSNPYSIVTFCQTRLNPQAIDKLIKENNGLGNEAAVDEALRNGDYKKVLIAIWSERNKERRLTWLRSKQNEFHAPLMFEQAIAEFVASPTKDTFVNITFPLSTAACVRVDQDVHCFTFDYSITDDTLYNAHAVSYRMNLIYSEVTNNVVEKYYKQAISTLLVTDNVHIVKSKSFRSKYLELLKQIAKSALPSPEWIGYATNTRSMHPNSKWKRIRDDFLTTYIQANCGPVNETLTLQPPATDQKMENEKKE